MARCALPAAILVTSAVALTCQFIQGTDKTFPLLYFTVDSTVLAAAAAGFTLIRPVSGMLERLRASSAVAVLLSAVIYAALIAPASETGSWVQPHDDYWVRTATFLFHLVMPVLVTIDFITHDAGGMRLRSMLLGCLAWPLLYLVAVGVVTGFGLVSMPYPFLDPSHLGVRVAAISVGALTLLILMISTTLWTARRLLRVRRRKQKSFATG